MDEEIQVSPEISEDFKTFEEFCAENAGQELTYLEVVNKDPLEMDPITLAFCMRHLVRLSRELMDMLLKSLENETPPELSDILATKGIQLDKTRAPELRSVIFKFRDSQNPDSMANLVRALQLLTITRERKKVVLNLAESYAPPDEGWLEEDFGGDDAMLETVRAIEDPHWINAEEM